MYLICTMHLNQIHSSLPCKNNYKTVLKFIGKYKGHKIDKNILKLSSVFPALIKNSGVKHVYQEKYHPINIIK